MYSRMISSPESVSSLELLVVRVVLALPAASGGKEERVVMAWSSRRIQGTRWSRR